MKTWIDCAVEEVTLIYATGDDHYMVIDDGLYVTTEYDGTNLREALEIYFEYLTASYAAYPRFFINNMELSWR